MPREPLRTFTEMCEEFGVTQGVLMSRMGNDPTAPKPITRSGVHLKPQRYYKPSEMRKWWKSIQETKCPPQS